MVSTVWTVATLLVLTVAANLATGASRSVLGRELIEYPIWAVLLGLLLNWSFGKYLQREKIPTEFFLKTGLVLLGATINFGDLLRVGTRGLVQAIILVTAVFLCAWYVGKALRLEPELRAVMAAALSICGVSAAIAAAGAVRAKRSDLTYVAGLVILFAIPLMLLQPALARVLDLSGEVAGAWIGGNIDTTAAVVGAGAIHSEAALKVASVVKISQNALISVVAFVLSLLWITRGATKPHPVELWRRFPKFIIGFVLASVFASFGTLDSAQVSAVTNLRNWFLCAAFVGISLQLTVSDVRSMGWKPLGVYAFVTVFNAVVALGVAWSLFR